MQDWDVLRIETEFMRDIISREVEKGVKNKTGYDIAIWVNEVNAINKDGRVHVFLRADAEINTKDLKKICKDSELLKNLVSMLLKISGARFVRKFLINELATIIKKIWKKKLGFDVELQINDLDYTDKKDKSHVYLCADGEMKTEKFEEFFK